MKQIATLLMLLVFPTSAFAQLAPTPSFDDPRLQTVQYDPERPVRLVAFPDTNLIVILLNGDQVERATLSDQNAFSVTIVGDNDTLSVTPLRAGATATLQVDTPQRRYEFTLSTGSGLAAAYVIRFVSQDSEALSLTDSSQSTFTVVAEYELSGDRLLRPTKIFDDGRKIYIEWGEFQSLPAVFGIGPTGDEEAVNGHMRGGVYTIDRIYAELVFRIDKDRVKARRKVLEISK